MALDPEEEQARLDALQREIDKEKQELAEDEGETQRRFIDRGEQEPVDDTIAPPG